MTAKPAKVAMPTITMVPTAALVPYARNAKKHSRAQVAKIAAMIQEVGFLAPVVIDDERGILAGHGRTLAAEALGLPEVPCIQASGLTEAQKRTYMLADNRLAEDATWDKDILRIEIRALQGLGADPEAAGFTRRELEALLAGDNLAGAPGPEADTTAATFITRPGDLWTLGEHRLICGDSTEPKTADRLMTGRKAALVFTDPPYGVDYQSASQGGIQNDGHKGDALVKFLKPALANAVRCADDDAAFYIWHASATRRDFEWALDAVGLAEIQYLTWVKDALVLGRSAYHWQTEPCFFAARPGRNPPWYGGRDQTTVWRLAIAPATGAEIAIQDGLVIQDGDGASLYVLPRAPKGRKVRAVRIAQPGTAIALLSATPDNSDAWQVSRDARTEYVHPTQKPPELAARAIRNHTIERDLVLDLFGGSGSTLIAAQATGRRARLAELEPKFCDAIVRRWVKMTGQEPTRVDASGADTTPKAGAFSAPLRKGDTGSGQAEDPQPAATGRRKKAVAKAKPSR